MVLLTYVVKELLAVIMEVSELFSFQEPLNGSPPFLTIRGWTQVTLSS